MDSVFATKASISDLKHQLAAAEEQAQVYIARRKNTMMQAAEARQHHKELLTKLRLKQEAFEKACEKAITDLTQAVADMHIGEHE